MERIKQLWETRKEVTEEIKELHTEAMAMRDRLAKVQAKTKTLSTKLEAIDAEIDAEVNKEIE